MNLYDNIKRLRKSHKMSQEELAKRAGYTDRSSIAKIENGGVDLSQSKIQLFADIFGVTPSELMDDIGDKGLSSVSIPLFEAICCGNGGFVDDNVIDYITLPSDMLNPAKEYFAQYASGDSMIDAGINPGDLLVFRKTGHIDSGQIGCFCIDENEAVCKRYRVTASHQILLMPENDAYDPIVVDVETQHFRCLGKLALVISDREKG